MSSLRQSVGRKVQDLRKQKGLTQEELAERMDCDCRTVSAIERGRNITLDTLEKLAEALEVHPTALLPATSRLRSVSLTLKDKWLREIMELVEQGSEKELKCVLTLMRGFMEYVKESQKRSIS